MRKKNSSPKEESAEPTGCGVRGDTACPAGPPRYSPHPDTSIRNTVAVMSGKGGVGKSAVTMLLAVALRRRGFEVGILDADITGPSVPRGLGVSGRIFIGEAGPVPGVSSTGIKVMSMNLILDAEDDAVIWRGPLISSAVGQFYQECEWGDLDYLLIDLPPGTADVPLTVMQSIPLNGIILVTTPQELAGMIVGKAVSMAAQLEAPITGLIENMSYVNCPSCAERVEPFGPSHGREAAAHMRTAFLGSLPLDRAISELADRGKLEEYESSEVDAVIDEVIGRFADVKETKEEDSVTDDGKKRIAIVMAGGKVSAHFGQCEEVMIAEIEEGRVKSREVLPAPPHDCAALPNLFVQKGVGSVVAGGMGAGAINNLERAGIRVYAGVQGAPEDALESLIAGTLAPGVAICGGGHGDGCAH
ncbi:MAG: P-loop NTPase [Actinobacteria bacterium]|nr:P-loop NTPase [Actinomycetota bacterium]MBU1943516.1 P-loop NTPase [Actinomycetota bacterium]MBU2686467.1 P-loop NTPase [Actinomycetota bacterium]